MALTLPGKIVVYPTQSYSVFDAYANTPVWLTAYAPGEKKGDDDTRNGSNASGINGGRLAMGQVAVDPALIPYGSTVIITGSSLPEGWVDAHGNTFINYLPNPNSNVVPNTTNITYIATDTGSAVIDEQAANGQMTTIDLFYIDNEGMFNFQTIDNRVNPATATILPVSGHVYPSVIVMPGNHYDATNEPGVIWTPSNMVPIIHPRGLLGTILNVSANTRVIYFVIGIDPSNNSAITSIFLDFDAGGGLPGNTSTTLYQACAYVSISDNVVTPYSALGGSQVYLGNGQFLTQ